MDLFKNPFHILTVTTRDNRQRIMELADDRSLLHDSSECMLARSDLTNPRKRLSAEISWLPGLSPKHAEQIMNWLSIPVLKVPPEKTLKMLSPIARANSLASGLQRLVEHNKKNVVDWILEIASAFEDIDPEKLSVLINEDRVVSGFPEETDLSAIESGIRERRHHYQRVIKSALDKLSSEDLVEAITCAVEIADEFCGAQLPILISDIVDSYELEAQGFLEKEEGNIKALVENLRAAVDADRPDSALTSMISQLIQVVKNWDTVAQPIQVSSKSRGLDHNASHRLADLIRELAIWLFNEHDKLNFSQQLTNMLQEVFAEVVEVAERTAEDADVLSDIAEQRALDTELMRIKDLVDQIKAAVDDSRPDSYLSPLVRQLCQLVKNWDIKPEQEASKHAAWLVRDLAIHMFNKHDKLDFSQQINKALLDVFADAGEISERIKEDSNALCEISKNRDKLTNQFREFDLNGDTFSYKGQRYCTNNINHIGFYRAITNHKVNFVSTGKTEEARIYLTMNNGKEVRISVDEQGLFFKKDKYAQIKTVVEFYSYLSNITFDRRVEFYESQIRDIGWFIYDKCNFFPNEKIVFKGRDFKLNSTSFLRGYGYVEMRKKDYGILDKIKREVSLTKTPQFSTIIDTDVIFHLLDKHFSLSWKS